MSEFQFDIETRCTPIDESSWAAKLSERWNIGDKSNGGYLVGIVLRALSELSENPDPITISSHFLRPGIGNEPGIVRAEVVKHGRTMTTLRGVLEQEGKKRVEVLAGFGNLGQERSDRNLEVAPPEMPDPEDCVPRIDLEQGVYLPILDRVDVRIRPDQAVAGNSKDAVVSGWIRFEDGREPDVMALPLFADAFPPSLFAKYGYIGWVPTLELTVHVRRRPSPGWVLASFETDDLHNGLFIETGTLWDSEGRLVARSRQLAMLRPT